MTISGTDQAGIDSYVSSERQRAMDELAKFLVANGLGREGGLFGSRRAVRWRSFSARFH
ncbi:MAG: hypothetical protein K2Z80_16195 [Xanthobacteraceae bacterium]|nr:hypothetical protein [Xanthobacteraceae bacterium]